MFRNLDLVSEILERGTVTADHVARLRRKTFVDGVISRADAELLFKLNERTSGNHAGWQVFFVDALVDYFVWQSEPRGGIDDAAAASIVERIAPKGWVETVSGFELVLNICDWAEPCPGCLRMAVLDTVRHAVTGGGGPLSSQSGRRGNVIGHSDVLLLRTLTHPARSETARRVSRAEADILLALYAATLDGDHDPAWQDLITDVLAGRLAGPEHNSGATTVVNQPPRDRWLMERRRIGVILGTASGLLAGAGFADALQTARRARSTLATRQAIRGIGPENARATTSPAKVAEGLERATAGDRSCSAAGEGGLFIAAQTALVRATLTAVLAARTSDDEHAMQGQDMSVAQPRRACR